MGCGGQAGLEAHVLLNTTECRGYFDIGDFLRLSACLRMAAQVGGPAHLIFRAISDQFAVGFSADSIIRNETGTFWDSNFRPSCCCKAVESCWPLVSSQVRLKS